MFTSHLEDFGPVDLPPFTGVRVMMQPFDLARVVETLPNLPQWVRAVEQMRDLTGVRGGVAYLTIDEAEVAAGDTHRRPGLHVDGVGPDGKPGAWGGGGGSWSACGMVLVASHVGCRAWRGAVDGEPGADGCCAHLADLLRPEDAVELAPSRAWACGPLTVHESIPMARATRRQVARLSLPSSAPWFEGYTPSPVGVRPTGPILPRRPGMEYRPSA